MYFSLVPMLTTGSLALYFGGEEILQNSNVKNDQKGSPLNPAFFTISLLFHISFYTYKKFKWLQLSKREYSIYLLKNIIASGNKTRLKSTRCNLYILSKVKDFSCSALVNLSH